MPKSSQATSKSTITKTKRTRNKSSLTPSQLERKRANDRASQRAIRTRKQEYIQYLEREIENLKSPQWRHRIVQELLHDNRTLSDQILGLQESIRQPAGHSYLGNGAEDNIFHAVSFTATTVPATSPAGCKDNLISFNSALPFLPSSPVTASHFNLGPALTEFHPPNASLSDITTSESWQFAVRVFATSGSSSPSTYVANTDEYGALAYIPASIPAPMREVGIIDSGPAYPLFPPARNNQLSPPPPMSETCELCQTCYIPEILITSRLTDFQLAHQSDTP